MYVFMKKGIFFLGLGILLLGLGPIKKDTVSLERYYYVKGMTCQGCVLAVKHALLKAGILKNQILEVDYRSPDPKNHIGHVKLKFLKSQYQEKKTDCLLARAIEKSPGYGLYWDAQNPNPECKETQRK